MSRDISAITITHIQYLPKIAYVWSVSIIIDLIQYIMYNIIGKKL